MLEADLYVCQSFSYRVLLIFADLVTACESLLGRLTSSLFSSLGFDKTEKLVQAPKSVGQSDDQCGGVRLETQIALTNGSVAKKGNRTW